MLPKHAQNMHPPCTFLIPQYVDRTASADIVKAVLAARNATHTPISHAGHNWLRRTVSAAMTRPHSTSAGGTGRRQAPVAKTTSMGTSTSASALQGASTARGGRTLPMVFYTRLTSTYLSVVCFCSRTCVLMCPVPCTLYPVPAYCCTLADFRTHVQGACVTARAHTHACMCI